MPVPGAPVLGTPGEGLGTSQEFFMLAPHSDAPGGGGRWAGLGSAGVSMLRGSPGSSIYLPPVLGSAWTASH